MTNQVIHGDCMEVLAKMEDNCIDTIITDPPYGLKFMSKNWDHGIPGIPFWAEMLRVAKPGAMLLAFGGTRTHHRLMVAIEDAGWEIRDCLMWLYGSGFPKSHNISKGIDRAAGKERESKRIKYTSNQLYRSNGQNTRPWLEQARESGYHELPGDIPATEAAKTFDGFGTGLKPAYEPIIYAMKPIEQNYANNAQVWGVAGLNIDGARIGTDTVRTNGRRNGTGNSLELSNYKSPEGYTGNVHSGRWPSNVLLSHAEGCVRRGERKVKGSKDSDTKRTKRISVDYELNSPDSNWNPDNHIAPNGYADPNGLETVADWECVDGCPIRILDEQAGVRKSGNKKIQKQAGIWSKDIINLPIHNDNGGDSGSASRFFYTAKAPNREKWFYCQLCQAAYPNKERDDHGHDIPQDQRKHIVAHPTVKPLEILKYLCTLTKTPSGGVVLDPFAGSGTTALACIETGRDFILIEKESDYYEIAKARVESAMSEPRQAELF